MPNHTTASQEDTMALDPHHDAKQAFAALFTRETVTRSSQTFGGKNDPIHAGTPIAAPNHNGVIITVNRYTQPKAPKATTKRSPSASAARKALLASIPVIISR